MVKEFGMSPAEAWDLTFPQVEMYFNHIRKLNKEQERSANAGRR